MKKIKHLVLAVLAMTMFSGCIWTTQQTVFNALDVTVAVTSFETVKTIVDSKDYSAEDQAVLDAGRKDFQDIVDQLTAPGNIINMDQVINAVDALKKVYEGMYVVIGNNEAKYSPGEWYQLKNFDATLVRIEKMAEELKAHPDAEKGKELASRFLEVLSLTLKLAPLVIAENEIVLIAVTDITDITDITGITDVTI